MALGIILLATVATGLYAYGVCSHLSFLSRQSWIVLRLAGTTTCVGAMCLSLPYFLDTPPLEFTRDTFLSGMLLTLLIFSVVSFFFSRAGNPSDPSGKPLRSGFVAAVAAAARDGIMTSVEMWLGNLAAAFAIGAHFSNSFIVAETHVVQLALTTLLVVQVWLTGRRLWLHVIVTNANKATRVAKFLPLFLPHIVCNSLIAVAARLLGVIHIPRDQLVAGWALAYFLVCSLIPFAAFVFSSFQIVWRSVIFADVWGIFFTFD